MAAGRRRRHWAYLAGKYHPPQSSKNPEEPSAALLEQSLLLVETSSVGAADSHGAPRAPPPRIFRVRLPSILQFASGRGLSPPVVP